MGGVATEERGVSSEAWVGEELDRILTLADKITILSAHLHAGEHRLMELIAEYDRCRGWEAQGYRNTADFLAFMTGMDKGAARERVRTAKALEGLPEISAAMSRGELSFSKVRALTRVATGENEGELLEVARRVTAAELERFVRGWWMKDADEAGGGDGTGAAPLSGTRAERYQVVLHVTEEGAEPAGAELDDGTRVSEETSRRISCDSSPVRMEHDGEGKIVSVGRKTRTIPPALRRALDARDRGCRFPGCGLRFTDAHHVRHWSLGGETSLENLILLCRHHHRRVHEGGFRVDLNEAGRPTFFDPRGVEVPTVPPRLIIEKAVELLMERNRANGVTPDWDTASADHRHVDHLPLDVVRDAREALLERFG